MRTDSIFYELFAAYPASFFELLGLPAEEARAYRFDSVEVKQTAFRIDGVFLPLGEDSELPVIFAEIQFQSDRNLYKRLFSEIFLYLRHEGSNPVWRAVVVFAKRSYEPTETANYQPLLDSPLVSRLYLEELEKEEGPLGVEMVRLVVESESDAPQHARQLLNRAQQLNDAEQRREIVDLIETIVLYKFPRMSREEIETMLGLNDLKQTKVYQEALEEGREEGIYEERHRMALEMLTNGMSVEQVSKLTQLPKEEIQQIKKSISNGSAES